MKEQQLEELKQIVNATINPEEKDALKKKILELEKQLGNENSIYEI